MAVFGAILAVVLLNVRINGEITPESIGQFNIGQLFAFYKAENLCKSNTQFGVAKRSGTTDCQWKIGKDFERETIGVENLPVEDKNGNCYFTCITATGKPPLHAEKVINRKLKKDGIDRNQFDLYTFLAPCYKCIEGTGRDKETAELEKYKGVYYSYKPEGVETKGSEVKNDKLLEKNDLRGLLTIIDTTKVTLSIVKDAINNGKDAKKSKQEIIDGVTGDYQKNAVKSYLDQHPLN